MPMDQAVALGTDSQLIREFITTAATAPDEMVCMHDDQWTTVAQKHALAAPLTVAVDTGVERHAHALPCEGFGLLPDALHARLLQAFSIPPHEPVVATRFRQKHRHPRQA